MKALRFLRAYWYIPVFVGGVILVWILTGGKKASPIGTIVRELEAIRAGSDTRELTLKVGKEKAVAQLHKDKAEEIKALDAKSAAKAKELEDDPVVLSKFLIRSARS